MLQTPHVTRRGTHRTANEGTHICTSSDVHGFQQNQTHAHANNCGGTPSLFDTHTTLHTTLAPRIPHPDTCTSPLPPRATCRARKHSRTQALTYSRKHAAQHQCTRAATGQPIHRRASTHETLPLLQRYDGSLVFQERYLYHRSHVTHYRLSSFVT